jgi:hypothetical protein
MKTSQLLAIVGLVGALGLGAGKALAQPAGPGSFNFDPAQIQKMIMDRVRERLEVRDDAEWKVLEERIQKVMDARREVGFGGGLGMMRMFMGARRGGRTGGGPGGPGGGPLAAFAPTPGPEEQALEKAIDAKASNAELKAALAKFFEARKQKQANLEKAQAELRKVLTVRQEAIAARDGLL